MMMLTLILKRKMTVQELTVGRSSFAKLHLLALLIAVDLALKKSSQHLMLKAPKRRKMSASSKKKSQLVVG